MSAGDSTATRRCTVCKSVLPETREHFRAYPIRVTGRNPEGWTSQCVGCLADYGRKWHQRNPDAARRYRAKSIQKDPAKERRRVTLSNRRLKARVLVAYSPGGPACACCGETAFEFLTIDHVNGDGAAHRRAIGARLYDVLVREKFPPGYRVLCMNCNWANGKYGYCPHQTPGVRIEDLKPRKPWGTNRKRSRPANGPGG